MSIMWPQLGLVASGPAWCRGLRQRGLLVAPRGVPLRPAVFAAAPGGADRGRSSFPHEGLSTV